MRQTRNTILSALVAMACTVACSDDSSVPGVTLDAEAIVPQIDAAPPATTGKTAAACTTDADCLGGTCLGAAGGSEAGNPRFTGGYCTTLGCTAGTQSGCGTDEWCIDGAGAGSFCVKICSASEGLVCDRADQICLGLGTFGGCFASTAAECDAVARTGCQSSELCVRIGFDDPILGRCEALCDPMASTCPPADACSYVRFYDTAFCVVAGGAPFDDPCSCDTCCVPGASCTPDLDGDGSHCKATCLVGDGCVGGQCVALEPGSPWGGCFIPGSPGT